MKRRVIILLVLFVMTTVGLFVFFKNPFGEKKSSGKNEEYTYQTFQIGKDQWGYSILHFDKPFIKQIHIPAVEGNLNFHTEAKAEMTAKLVLNKLHKKELPSVSVNELEKLGVIPVNGNSNY